MGIPLPVIGALLILTVSVFFTRFLPYPIGWIILSAASVGRWLHLIGRSGSTAHPVCEVSGKPLRP